MTNDERSRNDEARKPEGGSRTDFHRSNFTIDGLISSFVIPASFIIRDSLSIIRTFPFRSLLLATPAILAGCASSPKPSSSFPVAITSSPQIQITNAQAQARPYGLVIKGQVRLAPDLQIAATHSVDIVITSPDGLEIRKFTSQYFPAPKIQKPKPQRAHFTMVTYAVPPAGSVIKVSVTPEQAPGQSAQPAPENP